MTSENNGFQVGDVVFVISDARRARIEAVLPDEEQETVFYRLEGIAPQVFEAGELSFFDPDEPSPLVSEALLPEQVLTGFVDAATLTLVIFTVRQEIEVLRRVVLALDAGITRSVLDGAVDGVLVTLRTERNALAVALGTAISDLSTQLVNLESMVTTQLSEISNRQQEIEAVTEEAAGLPFLGLVREVGAFLSNPIDFVLSRSTEFILSEVNDGLNR